MNLVYKIVGADEWAQAKRTGVIPAAEIDRRDGYIHLSAEDQVLETARLYFAGRDDLVAVEFASGDLGGALKWEPSRGGALFPHLYADLPASKAVGVKRLTPVGAAFEFGEVVK